MAVCAFCRRDRTLTREHVFPDWLINEFPSADPIVRSLGFLDASRSVHSETREEPPDSTVRVVCTVAHRGDAGCNGGWMSALEEAAKPVLKPLAHGARRVLSPDDQRLIAYWATKTMMMIEFTDNASRATSPEHRSFLYEHQDDRSLPPRTSVFIGELRDPPDPLLGYWHRGLRFNPRDVVPELRSEHANAQQTTVRIGHLVLVVFSSAVDTFPLNVDAAGLAQVGLSRLPAPTPLSWPCGSPLDWPSLVAVGNLLNHVADDPRHELRGRGRLPARPRDE